MSGPLFMRERARPIEGVTLTVVYELDGWNDATTLLEHLRDTTPLVITPTVVRLETQWGSP